MPSFTDRAALSRWPHPTLWWWVSSHTHTHTQNREPPPQPKFWFTTESHANTKSFKKPPARFERSENIEHRACGALHYEIFHSGSKYFQDYSVNAMCTPYTTLKMAFLMFLVLWARPPLHITKQPPWKVQQKPQLVWDFPEVATISQVLGKIL